MPEWTPAVICPQCGSDDTRFVEPCHEMSVYECMVCSYRFEIDEGQG